MARKYTVVEIDGIKYELHGVKSDKKSIGFVPVRQFAADGEDDNKYHEFAGFVETASDGEMELIIDDYKYGNAVRLQGMARKAVEGEGFSEAIFGKMFNDTSIVTKEVLMEYHGNHDGLREYCKKIWESARKDVDTDEKHVWEELL